MEDFFAAVEGHWPQGREDYHWHVLPGTELLRDRLSGPYAQLISRPGLTPIRPPSLHVTIQHLAPASDITGSELDQIRTLVRDRCAGLTPFAVTAGPAQAREHGTRAVPGQAALRPQPA
jgi:hypothetical protein